MNNYSEHSDINLGHSGRPTNRPIISIIAAIGEERELGKDNQLLWRIPEDMKRFRKKTLGHPVIVGRKTFASLGKPLVGRTNIVITRNPEFQAAGCIIVTSIEEALRVAKKKDPEEVFIIGGGEIYQAALPYADKLYLTIVHQQAEADTFFPDYSQFSKVVSRQEMDNGEYKFTFLELTRE